MALYRFRIIDSHELVVARFPTLQQVYEYLKLPDNEYLTLYVEDNIDELEVSAEDIIDAFDRGETPEDLQFF